ncbi:MAG: DsbA family protein, partial [Thermoplasmata archaeon]|nr:DsbA family protein [Thermoplasmata archaeon]
MLERLRHPRGAPKAPRPIVTVTHFADPFCWWSFGLEPVLRRLKGVYGDQLAIEYRMGGVFTDIAAWRRDYNVDERTTIDWTRESAATTGNPVDVDYMRKTGVRSTHPACLAFKAAQLQGDERADAFFRRMMVAFQVECQPATEATLRTLAVEVGLDAERLERDVRSAA